MVLNEFFDEQIRELRQFLEVPGPRLRVVLTDEDTKTVTHRLLAGLENKDDMPHVFVPTDAPFTSWAAFFERAYADLVEVYAPFAEPLGGECVLAPREWSRLRVADPGERFAYGVSLFANALPEEVGAVVFIIDPSEVTDPTGYRSALLFLAQRTPSDWVKFIVLDDRQNGHTPPLLKQLPDVGVQSMYLAPDEMEKRIKKAMADGIGVTPADKRTYTALLASFAQSRREFDTALTLQREQLEMVKVAGTTQELAASHYNLGNIHLAKNDYIAAIDTYREGLNLALDANILPLVPVILTNLGVSLFRADQKEQAVSTFEIARVYCRKLNSPPTDAHILDCMALCHLADGRAADAARCWEEALRVYDGISAGPLKFARDGGRQYILAKLEHLHKSHPQLAKAAQSSREAEGVGNPLDLLEIMRKGRCCESH
jgi:tetratricopeptide (TPR) repeat protein